MFSTANLGDGFSPPGVSRIRVGRNSFKHALASDFVHDSISHVKRTACECRKPGAIKKNMVALIGVSLGAPRLISKQILMRSHIVTPVPCNFLRPLRTRSLVTCRYFPQESGTVLASMITRRLWFGLKRDRPSERVCSLSGGKVDELSSLHPFESKRVSETGFVSKRGLSE